MGWYPLIVFVHLFSAVLLMGFVLFWAVMSSALAGRFESQETNRLLALINSCRWPPVAVPDHLRIPLVGWAGGFLGVLFVSGVLLLELLVSHPELGLDQQQFGSFFDKTLHVKLLFSGMLVTGLVALAKQPRPWLIYLNSLVTLAIVVLSALLGN